jgi:hypothetical protein
VIKTGVTIMAAQGSHFLGAGTHAMLPYLTAGGLMMLGWRLRHRRGAAGLALANAGAVLAASFLRRNRNSRGARNAANNGVRNDRGRTIYRNTPMADVGFDTQGIP